MNDADRQKLAKRISWKVAGMRGDTIDALIVAVADVLGAALKDEPGDAKPAEVFITAQTIALLQRQAAAAAAYAAAAEVMCGPRVVPEAHPWDEFVRARRALVKQRQAAGLYAEVIATGTSLPLDIVKSIMEMP